jgi:hypothetical protein
LEQRQVDPALLIAAEFELSQALDAFGEAARPGMLKVLVRA